MDNNLQALLLFAVSAAFTPGPNNLMATASGANFGYWRSLSHILGVTFGFPAMLVAMALGLVQIFDTWPVLHKVLRYAGAAYMLYLALRIATSTTIGKAKIGGQPLGFIEAALFQWVNPKAVIHALSALSLFTTSGENFMGQTLFLAVVTLLVTFSAVSTWCLFGSAIGQVLASPRALRSFNLAMAGALVISIALIFK